jgi:hypothetical protein
MDAIGALLSELEIPWVFNDKGLYEFFLDARTQPEADSLPKTSEIEHHIVTFLSHLESFFPEIGSFDHLHGLLKEKGFARVCQHVQEHLETVLKKVQQLLELSFKVDAVGAQQALIEAAELKKAQGACEKTVQSDVMTHRGKDLRRRFLLRYAEDPRVAHAFERQLSQLSKEQEKDPDSPNGCASGLPLVLSWEPGTLSAERELKVVALSQVKGVFKTYLPSAYLAYGAVYGCLRIPYRSGEPLHKAALESELSIWQSLQKAGVPHVPQLVRRECLEKEERWWVEHCGGGDLVERFSERGTVCSAEQVMQVAEQVLEFLVGAHACGIVHADIKPDNLLSKVTYPPGKLTAVLSEVLVTDFGASFALGKDGKSIQLSQTIGTLGYMAPESRGPQLEYGFAADIWSLGMTLSGLRTNCLLFGTKADLQSVPQADVEKCFQERLKLSKQDFTPVDRWIVTLLQIDQRQRPTAQQALEGLKTLV